MQVLNEITGKKPNFASISVNSRNFYEYISVSDAFNEFFSTIRFNLAKSMSQVEPILDIKNATIALHFFNCFFPEVISVLTNLKPKKPNSSRFASISVYSRNLHENSSMSDAYKEFFSTIRSNLAKSIS